MAAPNDYELEVARGKISYLKPYKKWGLNNSLASGTGWVWPVSNAVTWQSAADQLDIVSTLAADADGGTGWDTINIYGLDANYDRIQELITLNGITPVTTTKEFIFVYRVNAKDGGAVVGSGEVNAGDITITYDGTGDTAAFIPAGKGSTLQLFDIVPNGHSLYIKKVEMNTFKTAGGQLPRVSFEIYTQEIGFGKTLERNDALDASAQNKLPIDPGMPYPIPEKTRWWIEATTDQNSTRISGTVSGYLVKE